MKSLVRAKTKKVRTETVTEMKLTGEDILGLLSAAQVLDPVPQGASVTRSIEFVVPSGADWSGDSITVDADNPVVVTITVAVQE